ncbi:hypothetical protein [Streptomyces sp. MST-110588]|uniref:hypothetical protein n=1 Tax=Streptomyces sp. MST-110588 TaxID=2833628 RepID=UPI001F5DAD83|nr:hypothetical protein [Streptomyces sp. MST-110588]UNO41621.1 hypothetical protein KGS77_21315 [Streptomyces sp. MST-110588]
MATASSSEYPETGRSRSSHAPSRIHTETKPAFKTTELMVYVAAVIAVLVASAVVGDSGGPVHVDRFPADQAWLYVTLLTIGYLLSRGLAKSGSREPTDRTQD